uniref:Uncharacterized protein n=1 Tax=Anguilla anguilla TaxID=7936 RepID=A0A0E9WZ91_ANGAN
MRRNIAGCDHSTKLRSKTFEEILILDIAGFIWVFFQLPQIITFDSEVYSEVCGEWKASCNYLYCFT